MATLILLTIGMHIVPTRLLEVGLPNAEYELEKRFCEGCTDANWGDNSKIEKTMATNDDKEDDKEDLQEKNR